MSSRSTISVHILTGFLGSGKTTLLNRVLSSSSGFGAETAIIVNEFGDIALDQIFIHERSEETIVLKSGCICCSVRTDLVSTLKQLAAMSDERPIPFKRIVIETSGISDPAPILITLRSDFNLLTRFHVGSIVCAVDATAVGYERAESMAQLAAADACVVTKWDLVEGRPPGDVEDSICALNPTAVILTADELASWFELKDAPSRDIADRLADLEPRVSRPASSHSIRSIVLRVASPQSWPDFAIWLSALVFQHGDKILRMKGLLLDQDRGTWIAVHGVRRFLHPPEHLQLLQPLMRGACLVFITEKLDPALIERSYRRWVLAENEPSALPCNEVEAIRLTPEFPAMVPVIHQGVVSDLEF
jgi:G3E family GTPase